jgi:UDP-N-acetylglucosamine transferase subunit ALG13
MIFLTVGTYPLPFERLIRATEAAIKNGFIEEEVFAQIGHCTYKPQNMKYVDVLEKEAFDSYFHKASTVISHAGIGTIEMALENHKPLLVMPRLQKYGEVVNKHQVATAHKFEELGHILVAYSEEELPAKLQQLRSFVPQQRKNQAPVVAARIAKFLNNISMFRKQS